MDDRASKTKGLLWLLGALALGGLLAVGVRPLAHAIPWSWERHLAQAMDPAPLPSGCRPSPQAQALLQRLVTRLYPLDPAEAGQALEVRVVRDPVVNAYAGLGGKITVNSGLLAKVGSPEELAGVLAHEMEHVRHRHIMEGALVHLCSWQGLRLIFGGSPLAGLARALLSMDFTRTQEAQADEAGLRRLQRAEVDTGGLRRFFERMQKDQPNGRWLSDHPDDEDRIQMAASITTPHPRPIMTAEEWRSLKAYGCGS